MTVRIALFLLIGLGLAGIAVTAFIGLRPQAVPASQAVATQIIVQPVQVLAAARVIHGGTLLLPDDVTSRPMLQSQVPAGAWIDSLDTRAATQGSMVRHEIELNQPILHDDIIRPGEHGFLSAVLRPGARAATIAVDAISGTAGLIWPGDHVDVILTQKLEDTNRPAGRRVVGETVLQDVRVIAVDQHMTEGVPPAANLAPINVAARTVTVEVMATDAEKLSVAESLGRLELVVRAATDDLPPVVPNSAAVQTTATPPTEKLVWSSDVSGAFRSPTSSSNQTVHLFIGPQTAPQEFHY